MPRGNIFFDANKRNEMLSLRVKKKYSYLKIAKKYNVHYTTIIYHCQKAGITLTSRVKDQMCSFIQQGIPIQDISATLTIPIEVIKLYMSIYGPLINHSGGGVFSKRVAYSILEKKKIIKVKEAKVKIKEIPTSLINVDDKGREWITDSKNKRIFLGKSEESRQIDAENRKKKELELKRLQMLTY